MADHAIGGVQRLVGEEAGQAEDDVPEGGCDDAIGEVLGQGFDGRAGDAWRIEAGGIAADDMADRLAPRRQALRLQGLGDRRHVVEKAPPREQEGDRDPLPRELQHRPGESPREGGADRAGDQHVRDADEGADKTAYPGCGGGLVAAPLEPADEGAHRRHRVHQPLEKPGRVADQPVQHQPQNEQREGVVADVEAEEHRPSMSSAPKMVNHMKKI